MPTSHSAGHDPFHHGDQDLDQDFDLFFFHGADDAQRDGGHVDTWQDNDHDQHSAIHQDLTLSVAPTATSGDYNMNAILDSPGPTHGRPLMILLGGATTDHSYWDPSVGHGKYSFVDAANKAGYATLNLDRLGEGASDKPPDALTSVQDQASELHQIIQSVKSGALSSYGFSDVIVVGHSLGSIISEVEEGTYGDANALVLTGWSHQANPAAANLIGPLIQPAVGAPPGYLTFANRDFAYDLSNTSSKVLAWDAQHIGTVTSTELATSVIANDPAYSVGIKAPVLEVIGDHDPGSFTDPAHLAAERAFFPNSQDFDQVVVKNSGHFLNLENNAQHTFDEIIDFAESVVPVHDHGHFHLTV